jgi:hypothetical protein
MLELGNFVGPLNLTESRTHFGAWCVAVTALRLLPRAQSTGQSLSADVCTLRQDMRNVRSRHGQRLALREAMFTGTAVGTHSHLRKCIASGSGFAPILRRWSRCVVSSPLILSFDLNDAVSTRLDRFAANLLLQPFAFIRLGLCRLSVM